jgi:hypothetical protein
MKRLPILLTVLFLALVQITFACECDSQGEFLTVAPKAPLVALVKVKKYLTFREIYDAKTPMSMEVEIIEVYKGTETRKTITVWGDNGILCRPYLSQFVAGKYYVIAFYKGSDGSKGHVHKDEKTTDYVISICGDYWLQADIKTQIATGAVAEKQTQISFAELKEKLSGK